MTLLANIIATKLTHQSKTFSEKELLINQDRRLEIVLYTTSEHTPYTFQVSFKFFSNFSIID